MAKKKIEEVTANETKAVENAEQVAENATEKVTADEKAVEVVAVDETAAKKAALNVKLDSLVKKWNDAFEYGEGTSKIDEEIDDVLGEYSKVAENECFTALLEEENPLKAAAEKVWFPVLKVVDVKDGKKVTGRKVEDGRKNIDPLRLHAKSQNGVGVDKKWPAMVEKLNCLLACRRAIELGLDPKTVKDTFAMSEQATRVESLLSETDPTTYDVAKANGLLLGDLQKIITAMIGEGAADSRMVNYLLMIYQKKNNKKALAVNCADHRHMCLYMLEICHAAVTNSSYSLGYKVKK